MTENDTKILSYLCFSKSQKGKKSVSFNISPNKEEAEKWITEGLSDEENDQPIFERISGPTPSVNDERTSSDVLREIMRKFFDNISGYEILINTTMRFLPLLENIFINNQFYKRAKELLPTVNEDEYIHTLGIAEDNINFIQSNLNQIEQMERGKSVLPGAILLSLVASFDSLIVDLFKSMINIRRDQLKSSDRMFSVSEILSMTSFNDVIEKVIDEEISNVMRGSHKGQIEFAEKRFNIQFPRKHALWSSFIEIFERRNLVAHGDLIINRRYLTNCELEGYNIDEMKVGDTLSLSLEYLEKSADTLIEFGVEIVCLIWEKNFPKELEQAYKSVGDLSYDLIRNGKSHLAARILEFSIIYSKPRISDARLKRMTMNLANAYKKTGQKQKMEKLIGGVDWSATSNDFQICLACLNEDIKKVVDLMPLVAREGTVAKADFREWPVFDWVRDKVDYKNTFHEVFGEPPESAAKLHNSQDRAENTEANVEEMLSEREFIH